MSNHIFYRVLFILSLTFLPSLHATEAYNKDVYHDNYTQLAFSLPMDGLDEKSINDFYVGNSFFKKNWVSAPASTVARSGLGPHYIARSCSSCHFMDGRSQPDEEMTGLQLKLAQKNTDINPQIGHKPLKFYGGLLTTRAIRNIKPEGSFNIKNTTINGFFNDGTPYQLLKPEYLIQWNYHTPSMPYSISPRVAPHIIGLGLLENINEQTIINQEDPYDENDDGISGRVNWVWDTTSQKKQVGKFGWKATAPSIAQQVASALINDMGITNPLFPQNLCHNTEDICDDKPHIEIPQKLFDKLVTYSSTLAVPQPRQLPKKTTKNGKKLFDMAMCSSCHTPQQKTGSNAILNVLNTTVFYPYTDLLLHDMGPELADQHQDFSASGSEWRTAPLWGIGLFETVNKHSHYMHDGRARNIAEAILWHGGEALKSQQTFLSMSSEERNTLITFVKSL